MLRACITKKYKKICMLISKMNENFRQILLQHTLLEICNIITSYVSLCTHRCFGTIVGCDLIDCANNHSRCACCQLNCTLCKNKICIFCMAQCSTCQKVIG